MTRSIPDQMPELVTRPPASWRRRLLCWIGDHEWCARVDLGAEPVPDDIKKDAVGYFFRFAAPVCRYCPRQLPPREPRR